MEQPSVREFMEQQGTYDQQLMLVKQAYLQALNKLEIAEKVSELFLCFS